MSAGPGVLAPSMPRSEPPPDPASPCVTIVLPVRNEATHVAATLNSVLAQDYPTDRLEVLVVDGGSTDGTRSLAAAALDGAPCRGRLLVNPRGSAAAGMNVGIRAARGSVIVRVDGHVTLPPTFTRELVLALHESGASCVGGGLTTVGRGLVGRALAMAMSSRFGVGGSAFRTGSTVARPVETVAFGAYRRDVLERLGGFDERFVRNQDDDLHLRILAAGGSIVFVPHVRSIYTCRASFGAAFRQFLGYGFWKVAVLRKHGRLPSWRGWAPAAFVAALAASLALAPVQPLVALAVVLPYVAANLLASAIAGPRRDAPAALLLPLAYVVLHLGYGCGFWAGVAVGGRRRDMRARYAS